MKRKSVSRKQDRLLKGDIPKRVVVKKSALPVTLTASAPKTRVRRYGHARVLGVAKRLKLWFDIANGTAKRPVNFPEWGDGILPDQDFEPLQKNLCASFERFIEFAEAFPSEGRNGPEPAEFIANASIFLPWTEKGWKGAGDLAVSFDLRFTRNPFDLRAAFSHQLYDAELHRFRRCPICGHFFYRVRTDAKGDGCSADCNNTLRQQRFRQSRAKQPRKLKLVGHSQA